MLEKPLVNAKEGKKREPEKQKQVREKDDEC